MMENRSFPDPSARSPDAAGVNGAVPVQPGAQALAHLADFALGVATVRPSLRRVEGPLGARSAEPRVMRVLLALAGAAGAVLTRDDLTRRCWDGRIVGDDAINRAIGELRRIARETGGGFRVETIPRTGYRLTIDAVAEAAPPEIEPIAPPSAIPVSRRLLIGGGIGTLAAGGWLALRPRADPRVAALVTRGEQALRDELPDSDAQGVGFFREALALEGENARAWGLLAMAHRNAAENAAPAATAAAVRDSEAAARRALALDPRQPDALAALAMLRPVYGDWLAAEERLEAVLAVAPGHATTLGALGILLVSVGRNAASAARAARAAELDPLSPVHQYRLAYKHWFAGDLPRADQTIDRALQLWPRHPAVWFARLFIFAFTGRAPAASAMLAEGAMLPPPMAGLWRVTLTALASRAPADIAAARAANLAAAPLSPGYAVGAIQVLSRLGDLDGAFAAAEGYLLRRGPLTGKLRTGAGQMPVNEQRWRKTIMLFTPASAAMRADPRFPRLCSDIGLAGYWHRRRIGPDYLVGQRKRIIPPG